MFAVTRPSLANWPLESDDLSAVANAWWGWCRLADPTPGIGYSLLWEARFEGFAPHQLADLQSQMKGGPIRRETEECLVTQGYELEPTNEQAMDRLIRWIAAPLFEHLTLRLRLVCGRESGVSQKNRGPAATLTLFGLIRDGRFLVQTLWQGGPEADAIMEHAPDPDEARLLEHLRNHVALDRSLADGLPEGARWQVAPRRLMLDSPSEAVAVLENLRRLIGEGGSVSGNALLAHATLTQIAQAVSQSRRPSDLVTVLTGGQERYANRFVWILFGDQQKKSFGDWVCRLALAVGITGVGAAGLRYWGHSASWFWLTLMLAGGALACWVIGYHAKLLWLYKTHMSSGLREVAYRPAGIVPVSFLELGLTDNPSVRKYSAEIASLGARLLGEIRIEGVTTVVGGNRVYVLPDAATVFTLVAMTGIPDQSFFPARASFHVETRFLNGTRLVSANQGIGYRKPLPGSKYLPRYWPDATTATAILTSHCAVIDRLVNDGGQVEPLDLEDVIPRMEREHGNEREERDRFGWYLWSDAFHEVFNIIRREYLEPGTRSRTHNPK